MMNELIVQRESSVSVCVESGVTGGFETALTVSLSAQDGTACEQSVKCLYPTTNSLCVCFSI